MRLAAWEGLVSLASAWQKRSAQKHQQTNTTALTQHVNTAQATDCSGAAWHAGLAGPGVGREGGEDHLHPLSCIL